MAYNVSIKLLALSWLALLSMGTVHAQKTNELAEVPKTESLAVLKKLRWISPTNTDLSVAGLPWFKENNGSFSRLPLRLKSTFRNAVWSLAQCPSGGRIRLHSDTGVLAIRMEFSSPPNMANMNAFGQTGIDAYVDGRYVSTARADADAKRGKIYENVLFDFSELPQAEREITLYLPLYKPVNVLAIGIEESARLSRPNSFARPRPVVFYGTSITQGGCASRPGLSYQAMLGRTLNLDFVNLGFSGNGLGEPEVARAVSEIDASCYVLDFGANHKSGAAMREVYEPFLDLLRREHPKVPIVVMTPLYTSREIRLVEFAKDWRDRRQFIEGLVTKHIKAGDKHLFVADGAKLLAPANGDGLVDGSHPNDLGFYCMAQNLAPVIRKALDVSTTGNRSKR